MQRKQKTKKSLQIFLDGVRNVRVCFDLLPVFFFFFFTEKSVIAQPIFVFEKGEHTFKVRLSISLFNFTLTKIIIFQEASYPERYHCCLGLCCSLPAE